MSIKGEENEAITDGDPETGNDTGGPSPRTVKVDQRGANLIEIDHPDDVYSIAFLACGEVVSGGKEGKIRRWRAEDGTQVGMLIDAGSSVLRLVVSRDGKRVVAGTRSGQIVVWNSTTFEKVKEFKAHDEAVRAVDISADGTEPFEHNFYLVTVKFSLDSKFIATATFLRESVRIYDSLDGTRISNRKWIPRLDGQRKTSVCLVLRRQCLDVSFRTTLSRLTSIHRKHIQMSITLTCDDACIPFSAYSSVGHYNRETPSPVSSIHHEDRVPPLLSASHPLGHPTTSTPELHSGKHNDVPGPSGFLRILGRWKKSIIEFAVPKPRHLTGI